MTARLRWGVGFFNYPQTIANPCASSLRFALDVRARTGELSQRWAREGFALNAGFGVACGYPTVGAIGSVTNLAARLCSEALGCEILVQQRALALAGEGFVADAAEAYSLKRFRGAAR